MPWLYAFFLVATLAGLGMPGMNSFVGEFSIMLGAFQLHPVYAVLAGVGVVLACWYMLRLHQGLMHDPPQPRTESVRDISVRQGAGAAPPHRPDGAARRVPAPDRDVARASVQQSIAVANGSSATTVDIPAVPSTAVAPDNAGRHSRRWSRRAESTSSASFPRSSSRGGFVALLMLDL